jgi:putative sterol carrier protein
MENVPHLLSQKDMAGIQAVIQFTITGDEGGQWYITITDQACTVHAGRASHPTFVIVTDAQTWLGIARREIHPVAAVLTGRVIIQGDWRMLQRLQHMLPI